MKKLTVLIGLLLVAGVGFAQPSQYALRNYAVVGPELNGAGYFANPEMFVGRTYVGTTVADKFVVAVDKSSTTLKGSAVNTIDLKKVSAVAEVVSGTWNVKVGVLTVSNGTNGTVAWLDSVQWIATGAQSKSFEFPGGALTSGTSTDSDVTLAGIAGGFISNSTLTTTALQNDAGNLLSPEAATISATTGDIIVAFDLASAAGELNLAGVTAYYALH